MTSKIALSDSPVKSVLEEKAELEAKIKARIAELLKTREQLTSDYERAMSEIASELKALGHKRPRATPQKKQAVGK